MSRHEYTGHLPPEHDHTLPDPTTQTVEQTGQLSLGELASDGGGEENQQVEFSPLVIVDLPSNKPNEYNDALESGRRAIAAHEAEMDISPEHSLSGVGADITVPDTDEWRLSPDRAESIMKQVKTLQRMISKELSDGASEHARTLKNLRTAVEDAFAETWERVLVAIEENPDVALKMTRDQIDPAYIRYDDTFEKAVGLTPHDGSYLLTSDDRRNLYQFWLAQAFAYLTSKDCYVVPAEDTPDDYKVSPSPDSDESDDTDSDTEPGEDDEMDAPQHQQGEQATLAMNA